MKYFTFMQLPMPAPDQVGQLPIPLDRQVRSWVEVRVERLNAWLAGDLERAHVRAELDAAAFHLFGLDRDDLSYVMETFPIVKRKDVAEFGTFRTKDLILASYDAMTEAKASGTTYGAPWSEETA